MKRLIFIALILGAVASVEAKRTQPLNNEIYVPEEGGIKFEKITDDSDCVRWDHLVSKKPGFLGRNSSEINWWINPQIAVSPDGSKIAYLNSKNRTSNVMVKNASSGGSSVQRTFRSNVTDFTWSPDGKTICFTEYRGGHYGIYLVDSEQGTVVRQITQGTENDFSGQMTKDANTIYFHRLEGPGVFSMWSYDRKANLFSNYSRGMTPCLIPNEPNTIYCSRNTDKGENEIWRINLKTGVEEIILSQQERSFSTPQLSPDGKWLLVTGTSVDEKKKNSNTDIFAVRTDGTQFTQLTYHPGNDMSAIWAPDGRSIYFISQRGSAAGVYNVWKMDFVL